MTRHDDSAERERQRKDAELKEKAERIMREHEKRINEERRK